MADLIMRFKVESKEYDNKLKRVAEGIQRLAAKIHDSQVEGGDTQPELEG